MAMERLQIYLPKELKEWLRDNAMVRGVSLASEIRSLLQAHMTKRAKKKEGVK